uniref:Uncharacterized protein n=1 Tax=Neogobius melanostomus TaxID=47308 RepID=A0A8C6SN37_9GOBI
MKIIHRAYVTPITLKKMNPNFSDLCWHGCGRTGTLNHMLWTCPDVRTFWAAVTGFIQDLLNVEIPNQFDVCVLGNTTGTLSKTTQRIAALGFIELRQTNEMTLQEVKNELRKKLIKGNGLLLIYCTNIIIKNKKRGKKL